MAINLPIFFDEHTPRPFIDPTIPWDRSIYPEDPGAYPYPRRRPAADRVYQKRKMALLFLIMFTWMRWVSEWDALVFN